jgi:hypothetical protein
MVSMAAVRRVFALATTAKIKPEIPTMRFRISLRESKLDSWRAVRIWEGTVR